MRRDKIKYGDRIVYEALNGNTLTIIAGKSFDGMNLADFTIKFGNVKSIERPNYQEIYNCEVLDKVEKKYLSAVIRPFKKEIKYGAKVLSQIDFLNDFTTLHAIKNADTNEDLCLIEVLWEKW